MAAAGRFHRWGGHLYADRFRPEGCRRHHVAADGVSGVVLVAACLVPLVTIFLFKRRLVQIRLCAVELVLLIGAGAMMGIYFYLCNRYFADSEFYPIPLKFRSFSVGLPGFRLAGFAGDLPGRKAGAVARPDSLTGRISRKRRAVKTARLLCLFCRERIRFGGVFDTK